MCEEVPSLIILIISADFLPCRDVQNELCLSKALLPPKTSTKAKITLEIKEVLPFSLNI